MVAKKPRIYDLAKILTSSETDEKAKKQKQTELTKLIMSMCEKVGYKEKSSSSALDDDMLEKLIPLLNKEGFNLNLETVNKELLDLIHNKQIKTPPPEIEAEKPKKQLKIVRRIKPVQATEETQSETTQESTQSQLTPLHEEIKTQTTQPQVKPIESTIESPIKEKKIFEEQVKPQKEKLETLQPFRVARPSITPSMMGRTKRPTGRNRKPGEQGREKEVKEEIPIVEEIKTVTITTPLTIKELAEKLVLPETEVVKQLFNKGIIRTVNQTLEIEIAIDLAQSLNYLVNTEEETTQNTLQADISQEAEEDLMPRPPVVTIMGHVDHGKTTLLDAIREAKFNVTDQEKGGITQHIGAYQIEVVDYDGNKRQITFLDTPGHEAFTSLRARGSKITDIAILVVAADDGVMPQTIEAIDHAKVAEVPIIIALNKIDKEGAQADRVLGQLAEKDLLIEDYGGKVVCSKVSAKKKTNLDDLLTKITLVADAELSEKLRANPNKSATGVVIEAELSKERGPIAHVLVQNGTLKKGDCIVAGTVAGRVRAMFDDHGKEVLEAPPSKPVELIGLPRVPHAGDTFQVFMSYQEAKKVAEEKEIKEKSKRRSLGLIEFALKVREGQAHELKLIIKADAHGSAEAVAKEVSKLSTPDVLVKPIHIGSGNITESDVNLAASADAIIIGFHVTADQNAQKAIADLGVDTRFYEIIYKITEDLEKAVLGLLEPEKEEIKLGVAEVRKIFTFSKSFIAGCYVTEGKIQRNQIAKVLRNGNIVFEGKIDNLKRFKDDAKEVQTNFECGISFEGFNDLLEGDKIECWTVVEKERTKL